MGLCCVHRNVFLANTGGLRTASSVFPVIVNSFLTVIAQVVLTKIRVQHALTFSDTSFLLLGCTLPSDVASAKPGLILVYKLRLSYFGIVLHYN